MASQIMPNTINEIMEQAYFAELAKKGASTDPEQNQPS